MQKFVITCEHSTNHVPAQYRRLAIPVKVLNSHRGWDIGALEAAKSVAKGLNAPLFIGKVSRLLVDLNRSVGHAKLFSEFVPKEMQEELLDRYYYPYRNEVIRYFDSLVLNGQRVVHISMHSFTPVFEGIEREGEVGFLYDPKRALEKELCKKWREGIEGFHCRNNYPYRGTMDGFVTFLRERYPLKSYLGIEIELNQKFPLEEKRRWSALKRSLSQAALQLH